MKISSFCSSLASVRSSQEEAGGPLLEEEIEGKILFSLAVAAAAAAEAAAAAASSR